MRTSMDHGIQPVELRRSRSQHQYYTMFLIYMAILMVTLSMAWLHGRHEGTRVNFFSYTKTTNISEVNPKILDNRGTKIRRNGFNANPNM